MRNLVLGALAFLVLSAACASGPEHQPSGPIANAQAANEPQPNTPPPGAEISDNPLVRAINKLTDPNSPDNIAAAQIATTYNIKSYFQCASWAQSPVTKQRVNDLLSFKTLLPGPIIKPVGPTSLFVAGLAAGKEVTSGDLAARLAAGRKQLDAFNEDANLNCAALVSDAKTTGLKIVAALAAGGVRP